jgi:AcrR family transcriptional regulator
MATTKATKRSPATQQTRGYSSQRRRAQALQTRNDVIAAAILLFSEHGWSGTTLAAVAAEAGVAVETVYSTFGSKKALLRAAMEASIVGDTEPIPMAERPEYHRMGTGPLADRIRAGTRVHSKAMERSARVWRAMREAAAADDEVAGWCAELEMARREQNRDSLRLILRRTLDGEQLDLIWALLSTEVYLKLREERGWSVRRLERWIARGVLALAGELPEFE